MVLNGKGSSNVVVYMGTVSFPSKKLPVFTNSFVTAYV